MNNSEELIQAVAVGNKVAFRTLYDNFKVKVYNTALSFTQNIEDAEEITQDVFTKIYKYAAKFKGDSTVNTWIYKITVNTSLTFIKRKKRFDFLKIGLDSFDKADFVHPGVLLENKELSKHLFKIIETLSLNQKTAFILSFIDDLPRKEVAVIMETSLKAIESLLQRAKQHLRKELEKEYPKRRNF